MKNNTIEARDVRQYAAGRWLDVLGVLSPALTQALRRPGRHVPCPVHGGTDGFRLFRDADQTGGGVCNTCGTFHDGFALLMWVNRWTFPEALNAVAHELGTTDVRVPESRGVHTRRPRPKERDRESVIEALNRVWQQSLDPTDRRAAPLRAYLSRRGLSGADLDGKVVRFHPALGYWTKNDRNEIELAGRYPAMVALVTDAEGEPVTVHRTYLTPDGRKAPVSNPKKLMGYPGHRLVGGAIRLFAPGPVLGVAEGIETALAVRLRTGMPVWSAVSANLLERVEPPAETSLVVVWADRDQSGTGETAAMSLSDRLSRRGVSVAVHLPPGPIPAGAKGIDWADVWYSHPDRTAACNEVRKRLQHKDHAGRSSVVFFSCAQRPAMVSSSHLSPRR
jgi:putative DNA primase/helicase